MIVTYALAYVELHEGRDLLVHQLPEVPFDRKVKVISQIGRQLRSLRNVVLVNLLRVCMHIGLGCLALP